MKWATTSVPSRTDLTYEILYNSKFIPVKSPKVSVRSVAEGDKISHLMFNFASGLYYELDETSKIVWDCVDDARTVDNIVRAARQSGKIAKSDPVIETLLFFAESGSLQSQDDVVKKKRIRVVSPFITEVTLIWDATWIFKAVQRVVRPLLRSFMLWASMAIVFLAVVVYATHFLSIFGDARNFQILGSSVVGFLFYNYVVLGPVIAVHELSHGLALVHYSGRASELGTGLFYFGPMFYVDVSGYWSLPRRQRMMIMWAGNLSTLLIGSIIVLVGLFFPYPTPVAGILDLAAFWCFYLTLWNLAPPFETDGYHILADAVNRPNLRSDAFTFAKSKILRIFQRNKGQAETQSYKGGKVLLGYALFATAFMGFIGFQTLRFTFYMASDAVSWTETILTVLLPGHWLSALAYAVGLTTIGYFALTLSGYGVLLTTQLRKIMARGLRFEALHDRDLSVFFYVPGGLSPFLTKSLLVKMRSAAAAITSNFSLGNRGPLYYANLRIGSTRLPISHIKSHLRTVERRFFRVYQEVVVDEVETLQRSLLSFRDRRSLPQLLEDIAAKAPAGDKRRVSTALRDFLQQQRQSLRYAIISTFGTVWTLEVPPAMQYELLTSLVPSLVVDDLVMTDLPGQAEGFKKQTIYGLDTIAELAAKESVEREEALARPERYQLVASFEPVRGRIIFIGRTETIEERLVELGSLFLIHVWSGYVDNLLGDGNLHLYSIAKSLPALPNDLSVLSDGEVRTLDHYVSYLEQLEGNLHELLTESREVVRRARTRLVDLKAVFPSEKFAVKPLHSILELNKENLESIPSGIKEVEALSKNSFSWFRALEAPLKTEVIKRQKSFSERKRKLVKSYMFLGPISALFVVTGVVLPATLLVTIAVSALAVHALFGAAYYILRSSSRRVPRYPSTLFTQITDSIYALTRTVGDLVIGARVLKLSEALATETK